MGQHTPTNEQFRRAPAWLCSTPDEFLDVMRIALDCGTGTTGSLRVTGCAANERAVDPLFRRVRDATSPTGWSNWNPLDFGACVVDADFQAALARELQRLPLTPSTLSVQPPTGWTLVNTDTIVYTDDAPQTLTTTVLGIPVAITASPARFSWNFGDGADPLTTTDPGHPWPAYTIAHQYTTEATRAITLTTTWTATYQLAGTGAQEPVPGTATTTSTSEPLTVYEARSRLVQDTT